MKTKSDYYEIEIESPLSSVEEQLYVKDLKQRKLFLNSEICAETVFDLIRHIHQINAEDKGIDPTERRPIILYISSPGGDVDVGFGLIDAIESSITPVYTVNTGTWYSMAFLVGLAGHTRYAGKNARFLMHDGSSFAFDSTSKVKDLMEFQDKAENRIKDYILSHTSITEEEYRDKLRVEWYMFSDEAKELGVCDKIIGIDCTVDEVV